MYVPYRNLPRSTAVGTGQLSSRPPMWCRHRAITLYPASRTGLGIHPSTMPSLGHGCGNSVRISRTASDRRNTCSSGPSGSRTTTIVSGPLSAPDAPKPCRASSALTLGDSEATNRSRSLRSRCKNHRTERLQNPQLPSKTTSNRSPISFSSFTLILMPTQRRVIQLTHRASLYLLY